MPTTTGKASEFITFSRTSNATVTDSDGKIKWAPHNLLLASEQFDSASWPKYLLSVTANAVAAPNGSTTADTATIVSGFGSIYQGGVVPIGTHTLSIFAKAGTVSSINLSIENGSGAGRVASFTLSGSGTAGAVTDGSSGAGTVSGGTSSITPLSDGWYLCTIASVTTTAANSVFLFSSNNGTFHLWGAHLYRSDLGGMKANASAYPMYNPTTPKNLLGFTEDFSNAAWVKGAATVTANSAVAPNGLQTADTISFPANVFTYQSVSFALQSGKPYTISFYVRADAATDINIGINGNSSALTNKAANVSVGTTWQRVSFSSTGAATETVVYVGLGTAAIGTGASVINEARTIYLWGAQLSDSASLDTYVPNYGAAPTAAAYYGPRLDADPVTLAQRGLLVEELRANLITYSSDLSNAAWGPANVNTTGTPPWINVSSGPDGAMSADKIIESNTTAQHYFGRGATVTSGATYSLSMYLKAGERTWAWLEFYAGIPTGTVYINLSTGAKGTTTGSASAVTVTDAGGGWWRVVLPGFVASSTTPVFAVYTSTGNGVNSYAGDGTSGIYLWGAQLEAGSFATSYIPVGATTDGATRNADVASVSTQAFPYNQAEGSVVVNATLGYTSTNGPVALTINDGTGNNEIYILQTVGTGTRRSVLIYAGGAPQATLAESLTNTVGLTTKVAGAFKLNDVAGSIDGGTVVTDTPPATIPTVNTMRIGNVASGTQAFNGHIRQITYLPRRISNTELQTRTSA